MIDLKDIEQIISQKANDLGYTQGWTLLYTGVNSFRTDQKLLFVGLNPGGKESDGSYYPILSACMEPDKSYNAYLDEDWDVPRPNPLQKQIQELYKQLHSKIEQLNPQHTYGATHEDLMRGCLSLNYVPFRSQSWDSLKNAELALKFSNELWQNYILKEMSPSAIITMNRLAYDKIKDMFINQNGYKETISYSDKTKWGKTTYDLTKLIKAGKQSVSLARCPHLSRYKLFSNNSYKLFQQNFISFLAKALVET